MDGPIWTKHPTPVVGQGAPVGRAQRPRNTESNPDAARLLPKLLQLAARERCDPAVVGTDAGHDERGLDPQEQLRIEGAVGLGRGTRLVVDDGSADGGMDAIQLAHCPFGSSSVAKDQVHRGADRPVQPFERVGFESAVLRHPLSDEWVGDLQQQCGRAGSEQHRFAVDAPHHRVGPVETQNRVCAPCIHRAHRGIALPHPVNDRVDLIVRNATLVTAAGRGAIDIAIDDKRFVALRPRGELQVSGKLEIDADGLVALPGVIDSHVHLREPGLEHEEDWLTGTRAAVMGGVTTVLDMPNTVPPTDTVERARHKRALADASAYCDFGIFGLLFDRPNDALQLINEGLVVGLKAFMGPTTGNLGPPGDESVRAALAKSGWRVSFHAEDEWEIESEIEALPDRGRDRAQAHLASRTVEAEVLAIDHVAQIVLESGGAGHVAHVSSIDGLRRIASWAAKGADLTCEVTPHHMLLDLDVYESFRGVAKVNPPIRGRHHACLLYTSPSPRDS